MDKSALPAPTTERRPAHRELVDLDALFPPKQITDRDGAMADLGRRVKDRHPGAMTTAAGVRAIRESWHQPHPTRRALREFARGAGTVLFASCMTIAWGLVALGLYVWIAR